MGFKLGFFNINYKRTTRVHEIRKLCVYFPVLTLINDQIVY